MRIPLLTLQPEALQSESTRSKWEDALVAVVREAAQSGQTVMVSTEPRLLTPEEAARRLMVSRSTISRRIAAGEIQAVTTGNRHRIPYTEVRRVWDQQMQAVAKASAVDVEAELFAGRG